MALSELVPHLGQVADEITLIRSMQTGANNHIPSNYALSTGRASSGRAVLGSWLTSALGSETQELPAYVALTDTRGLPLIGGENWSNGKLPSIYQGTMVRPVAPRIFNLDPPRHLKGSPQEEQLRLLDRLNREHIQQHPGENDLEARMKSYGLAARMQVAREAFDISRESEATKKMYGIDQKVTRDYGTRCLIARRLVERGVRFVQILCNGQVWDHHGSIKTALAMRRGRQTGCGSGARPKRARAARQHNRALGRRDGPTAGDPISRGLTKRDKVGRDHNTYGFSQWVAGGGFRRGYIHGQTDEFSHYAVDGIIHHYDWLPQSCTSSGSTTKSSNFALARATSDWSKTTRPAWPPNCSPDRACSGAWPSVILRLIFFLQTVVPIWECCHEVSEYFSFVRCRAGAWTSATGGS